MGHGQITLLEFESLPSTQSKALELARQGAVDGTVVTTREQTVGRGRHGRSWLSGEGSLCFSLVLTRGIQPETAFHWSFVAAVALAETLGVRIKWPNDLYAARKKVGGILSSLETEPQPSAVVGVGLNLTFDPGLPRAGALGTTVELEPLLQAILAERDRYLQGGPSVVVGKVRERLEFVGEKVQVVTQNGMVEGVLEGIDDAFALVLASGQRLSAGEVWPIEERQ